MVENCLASKWSMDNPPPFLRAPSSNRELFQVPVLDLIIKVGDAKIYNSTNYQPASNKTGTPIITIS